MRLTALLTSPVVMSLLLHKVMYSYVCCTSKSFKTPEVAPGLCAPLEETSSAL